MGNGEEGSVRLCVRDDRGVRRGVEGGSAGVSSVYVGPSNGVGSMRPQIRAPSRSVERGTGPCQGACLNMWCGIILSVSCWEIVLRLGKHFAGRGVVYPGRVTKLDGQVDAKYMGCMWW